MSKDKNINASPSSPPQIFPLRQGLHKVTKSAGAMSLEDVLCSAETFLGEEFSEEIPPWVGWLYIYFCL